MSIKSDNLLICRGQEITREEYPQLSTVILDDVLPEGTAVFMGSEKIGTVENAWLVKNIGNIEDCRSKFEL